MTEKKIKSMVFNIGPKDRPIAKIVQNMTGLKTKTRVVDVGHLRP